MSLDTIRVLLADDHLVVRSGVRALLGTVGDISVVCEASTGREAVALAERSRPDVVVMDLTMPDMDGLDATRAIMAAVPTARILILTVHAEDEYLLAALKAGASGYLVKSVAGRELIDAVRAVAHGDTYVQATAARALARGLVRSQTDVEGERQLASLSARERDVLRLIVEGHSGSSIGALLGVSPKTVETYKQRLEKKLGVSRRPELVKFALRVGLLRATPDDESAAEARAAAAM